MRKLNMKNQSITALTPSWCKSISAEIAHFVSRVPKYANTTQWKSQNSLSWPWHFKPHAKSPLGASLNQPVFEYYRVFNWKTRNWWINYLKRRNFSKWSLLSPLPSCYFPILSLIGSSHLSNCRMLRLMRN